jgi:hypothetical protein
MPTATPPCRFTRIQLVAIPSTDQDRSNRAGLDCSEAGYECVELVSSPAVAHARFVWPCGGTQVAQ